MDVIYTDIAKVFDNIGQSILALKLYQSGFHLPYSFLV